MGKAGKTSRKVNAKQTFVVKPAEVEKKPVKSSPPSSEAQVLSLDTSKQKSFKKKTQLMKKKTLKMGNAGKTFSQIKKKQTFVVKSAEVKKKPVKSSPPSSEAQVLSLDTSKQKTLKKKTRFMKKNTSNNPVKRRKAKKSGGAVFISHIPHGFYEREMFCYFSQFGVVSLAKVSRSPKTSRSMGYGYVFFLNEKVAKIVAETMDNYLMFGRLMKCSLVPVSRAIRAVRKLKGVTAKHNPKQENRAKHIKSLNKTKSVLSFDELKKSNVLRQRYSKKIKNLEAMGTKIELFSQDENAEPLNEEKNKINSKETNINKTTEEECIKLNLGDSEDSGSEMSDFQGGDDDVEKVTNEEKAKYKKDLEKLIFNKLKDARKESTGVKRKRM